MNKFLLFISTSVIVWLLASCTLVPKPTPTFIPTSTPDRTGQTSSVRVVLEADLPADRTISPAEMEALKAGLIHRLEGMGMDMADARVAFQGKRQVVVDLLAVEYPGAVVAALVFTGQPELVDLSALSPAQAKSFVGTEIATDFAPERNPDDDGTIYHTVLSGSSIVSATLPQGVTGQIPITFHLTEDGKVALASYITTHTGQVLAIMTNKVVMSTLVVRADMMDGQMFTVDQLYYLDAQSLAAAINSGALPFQVRVVSADPFSLVGK